MKSLAELKRERARLLKVQTKEKIRQDRIQEKKDLRREIFLLKHGRKIDSLKKLGEGTRKNVIKLQDFAKKHQRPVRKNKSYSKKESDYGYNFGGSIF